jgi:predicted RND superfamily exporter protein
MNLPGFNGLLDQANRLTVRHLGWIDQVTSRSPRLVIASLLLLVLLSLASLFTIHFETDIFRLFPADRPAMRLLLDSLEWSGGANEAYFLLEGEPAALPAEASRLAERLRSLQVDGVPAFKRVVYRIYEESEAQRFADLVAFSAAHPAAFVLLKDSPALLERFTPQAVNQALDQLTAELAGSIGASGVALSLADPLGLRSLILPRLKAGSQALDMDPASPYFLSRDGRVLIMIAEPVKPVQEMAFARKLVTGINQARSGSQAKISCAGAHISAVIDEAAMKANILSCLLSSLVVVLGIFYAVYRRIWPTLMIPVILAVGVLLALGTAGLFLSSIHIISFAFMALIIGLGTDYSIHLYDRFHTERVAGATTDQAVSLAVVDTGQGLFTAATTTALPFLALGWAEVRALSELGILVGLGVIFSLYTSLFLLPILLRKIDSPDRLYRPLPSLGLGRIWRVAGQWPRPLLWGSGLLVLLFLLLSLQTSFDGELKNLQPQHSEAFHAQELVEQHLNLAPKSLLVALDGATQAAVMQQNLAVEALVAHLATEGTLQAWSSLGQIMNRRADQQQLVTQLQGAHVKADELEKSLKNKGFSSESFQLYLSKLRAGSLTSVLDESVIIAQLAASPLRGVVDRHLVHDRSGWHALTYLYFKAGQLDQAGFVQELKKTVPAARVTGTDLVSQELLAAVRRSAVNGIAFGGILTLLLLLSHFKSVTGIFSSLGPVLFGAVAMLGTMALVGMKLNFMNIMVLVTIIGMGSDYGLHLQHRCAEGSPDQQEQNFIQAARSVLLSALTTVAGFGSLAFTDYGAMSSIGWATNFGIGFTALAALLLVPALLRQKANGAS